MLPQAAPRAANGRRASGRPGQRHRPLAGPNVTSQVKAGHRMYAEANVLHGIVNTGNVPMTFYFTKFLARGA